VRPGGFCRGLACYSRHLVSVGLQGAAFGFSMAAVCAWGTSDFLGGYAARRANAFLLTTVTHGFGLLLMVTLALATNSQQPSRAAIEWALAGGVSGGAALAFFYRALSSGSMGLTATIGAVLGAAIPAVVGIATEGWPGWMRVAGFVLAGMGIWLISRNEGKERPRGIGLAVLAGFGFAGFFLCMRQAGGGSALWLAGWARVAALLFTGAVVLIGRSFAPLPRQSALLGAIAGCLDASGTALFVRASQAGRLDVAVMLTSLYPAMTVVLARVILKEHFSRWKVVGLVAGLAAVVLIAA
jgi:drug/metabolite transporter (DMT)-like permease